MYIQTKLPDEYGIFNKIRDANAPFYRTFAMFVKTVAVFSKRFDYDLFATVGELEARLLSPDDYQKTVTLSQPVENKRIVIEDEDVERLYEDDFLKKQDVTVILAKLLIDLSDKYGSIPSVVRAINQIDTVSDGHTITKAQTPVITKSQTPAPQTPVVVSEGQKKPVRNKHNKRAIHITSEQPKTKTTESSSTIEKLNERAQQLSKMAAKTKSDASETKPEPGTVIKTNPLLSDFI